MRARKLGNRRVPNGTHGGVRGRMPEVMGILLLDRALKIYNHCEPLERLSCVG